MAVYTEVTDEALAAFLTEYDIGTIVAFRGIAEGVETQLLAEDDARRLHPDAVRKARRSGRSSLVRGTDGASGDARHHLPAPVRARDGHVADVGGPACRDHHLPAGRLASPRAGRALRAGGAALARLHLAGADYAPRRVNALGSHGWRPLLERCRGARGRGAAGPGGRIGLGADRHSGRLAGRASGRPYPRRSVPGQRVLPGRTICPA